MALASAAAGPGCAAHAAAVQLEPSIPTMPPSTAIVNIYQYAASGISSMGFQAQYAVSLEEFNAT